MKALFYSSALAEFTMHYWRKGYFKSLKDLASAARTVPEWADYAAFCEEYERGLRNDAFTILERFISSIERASFEKRPKFVSWISRESDGREGRHMLIPHPLYVRLIEPTLLEWTLIEPDCYEPHLWLGGYDHLVRAIELTPRNEIVAKKLIVAILSRVGHATHELPTGYLGNPSEDLTALSQADILLQNLSDDNDRSPLRADIALERKLIQDYIRSN
jgi:hypothetical protein